MPLCVLLWNHKIMCPLKTYFCRKTTFYAQVKTIIHSLLFTPWLPCQGKKAQILGYNWRGKSKNVLSAIKKGCR